MRLQAFFALFLIAHVCSAQNGLLNQINTLTKEVETCKTEVEACKTEVETLKTSLLGTYQEFIHLPFNHTVSSYYLIQILVSDLYIYI